MAKHVPQRTCIACRQVEGKRGLVRLVRSGDRVEVDPTGKKAGRGAYLHRARTCWEVGLKGNRIEQALRVKLTPADRKALQEFVQSLPDADAEEDSATGAQSQADAV